MSVQVTAVSKWYGEQKALDAVSFRIEKGQISGFLGPNGAGKSTMMKIITGFIPPAEGKDFVDELDSATQAEEIRRRVGYLPEHNPLYLDLYVREFLEFVGGTYRMKSEQIGRRMKEMIELTGLGDEQHKKIGALSKGYRQRVGLAQALFHDPAVLILDEPTTGLDPNQLVDIRRLIREAGREKTILLSTHIMQEVEAICDRVLIINKGKLVADSTTEQIRNSLGSRSSIRVEFDQEAPSDWWRSIQGIRHAKKVGTGGWKVQSVNDIDIRPAIFEWAVANKRTVITLQKEEDSLESVFRELTREA